MAKAKNSTASAALPVTIYAPPRRSLLASVFASVTGLVLPAEAIDPVKAAADRLGEAMTARHGGKWLVQVDHDTGFILIYPSRDGSAA